MQRRVDASKAAARRGNLWRQRMTSGSTGWRGSCCLIRHAVGPLLHALRGLITRQPPSSLAAVHCISLLLFKSNALVLFSEREYLSDFSLSFWLMQSASEPCLPFITAFSSACGTSSEFFTSQVSLESGCNMLYLRCSHSLPAPSPSLLPTELISGSSSDCCLLISHTWIVLYQQTCPSFSSHTV